MEAITLKLTPTQVTHATLSYEIKLTKTQLRQINKVFLSRAGSVSTPKKAAAARENGKLGGRPKGT